MVKVQAARQHTQRQHAVIVAVGGASLLWLALTPWLFGQEADADRTRLREPIYRISKQSQPQPSQLAATTGPTAVPSGLDEAADRHPLDPALAMAHDALAHIENHVRDYTCTLVKRERVQGELLEHEFISCKIRHGRKESGSVVPFGVYLAFRRPDSMRGREVIYVEGQNEGKIVAHEGGLKGRFLPTVDLMPTSALALRGNRYPITEIGILTLTRRLIEKGERDRRAGDCQVRMVDGAKVRDRVCTMLEVVHADAKPHYDFHLARVFLDNELKMPIRYEAYGWPQAGEKPPLLEEYTYMDVKVNVGLTDQDFSRENPGYRF